MPALSRRQLLAAPLLSRAAAADTRPNTIFILVDDLRFNALSCLGHPWLKTPNIDRLAREGAICTNAFVTTPLCSPSRASFLTGRWIHAHGIVDNTNRSEASHRLVTFPLLQQKAGYQTAYIGKWHMGNDSSPRPGFDHWVSFPGQGQYFDPPINLNGKLAPQSGFMTDILNAYAVEFLRRKHTKPFSLYLAHKAVHGPFTPPDRHQTLYADAPITRHPNAQTTQPFLQREIQQNKKGNPNQAGPTDETIRNQLRLMQAVDEGVGQLLQALTQSGQLDNTLIIFTSDNGYFHGDHGLGDKRAAYEESLRIPLLVRYPKWIKPGTKITGDILNVDIAPTMLEIAGATPPAGVKGKSIVPLLRGKAKQIREDFYAEYVEEAQFQRIPTWHAVRTREWKYVEYKGHPEWTELYHLKADPYETKNLAGEASAAKMRTKLAARLVALEKETA
jgi:arylsulfatase A-like enzyme